jgi:hypothetical protein
VEHFVSYVGTESIFSHDVHVATEKIFQILFDGDKVYEGASSLEIDKQVEITFWRGRAAGYRPEDAHMRRSVGCGYTQNIAALTANQ